MKQFFVSYYRDFGNTYSLFYAECPEDFAALPENAQKITRKEAEQLCREENERRRDDPDFSGRADNMIYPAAGDWDEYWYLDDDGLPSKSTGYIVPRCQYGPKHDR